MYEETLVSQIELREDVIQDGVKLGVIARRIEEDEWELTVENQSGKKSVWIEPFPTAKTALDAGIKAIKSEGVKPFTDGQDFAVS